MLRQSVSSYSKRLNVNLRRNLSSSSQNQPTNKPNSSGAIGGIVVGTTVGLVSLAYFKEKNEQFANKIGNVPGLTTILTPFGFVMKKVGIVRKEVVKVPELKPKKASLVPPVSTLKPPTTEKKEKEVEEVKETSTDKSAIEPIQVESKKIEIEEKIAEKIEEKPEEPIVQEDKTENKEPNKVEEEEKEESTCPVDFDLDPNSIPDFILESQETSVRKERESGKIPEVASEELSLAEKSQVISDAVEQLAKQSQVFRLQLEESMLKDLNTLDADALRVRVTQIAAELFERITWENLRVGHSLKEIETDLKIRYEKIMAKQRKELQMEVDRILMTREKEFYMELDEKKEELNNKYQDQLNKSIKAQAEGFQATLQKELTSQSEKIQAELQDQLNHEVALLRKQQVDELMEFHPKIAQTEANLDATAKVFDQLGDSIRLTLDSHDISAKVLQLEASLTNSETSMKTKKIAEALRKIAAGDDIVEQVIENLPSKVMQGEGIPSISELQVRFQIVKRELRKFGLAPEAVPKFFGILIGTALASVSWSPTGLVKGPGIEETLSRAAYYLSHGDLNKTIDELNTIEHPYAKEMMNDWVELAHDRLAVDLAVKTLKASAILRHKEFGN